MGVFIEKEKKLDSWFGDNYEMLKKICRNVSKEYDVDELLHFCIIQAEQNKKFSTIEDQQKFFFFTTIVRNNYYSDKSPFYKVYKKMGVRENDYVADIDVPNYEEVVDIDMDWVREQLRDLLSKEWYYGRIFQLYIEEECNLTKLSKKTSIPVNTLSRDIKYVRNILRERRNKTL
jgi:DNA-directed RNA polymerase specialized sigma24 family protein